VPEGGKPPSPNYALRALRLGRNPIEGAARVAERFAERRAGWAPAAAYRADADWERRLHERLGRSWPCEDALEFAELWRELIEALRRKGIVLGRAAFAGWDDADPAVARAVWCVTRHLGPAAVVETGVARGVTSSFALEALERNGRGHLWSIDLPPPFARAGIRREIGAAVPERLRHRWKYIRGSSRRRLPRLLERLGTVDLFLHDSIHTKRNVLFELETVWPALRAGGFVLIDDVDLSRGLSSFLAIRADIRTLIARADDGRRLFAVAEKEALSGPAS
jgi:hypothetical protein